MTGEQIVLSLLAKSPLADLAKFLLSSEHHRFTSCARVCRFALDMLRAVRDFNDTCPQHGPIDFRIGISTGPVVAGVVGIKRLLFDMW